MGDTRIGQGRDNAKKWLEENTEEYSNLLQTLRAKYLVRTLLLRITLLFFEFSLGRFQNGVRKDTVFPFHSSQTKICVNIRSYPEEL